MTDIRAQQNVPVELVFAGPAPEALPATNSVEVRAPDGATRRVPAFWDGGSWRVRVSSPVLGAHEARPDWPRAEPGTVTFVVDPYTGENELYRRGGPVRQGPRLAHADGRPFLWLGDTWWFGLGNRISDDEFVALARKRAEQGFSVVQIVAGLHVDVDPFHPLGNSAAGWPWTEGFGAINPQWWDDADRRIAALVDAGLVPCIVGGWGYYLQFMSDAQMQEHWRNVIARWGAYPVVFCIAGEVTLSFYTRPFTPVTDAMALELSTRWTGILRYIRATDPCRRPLTAHPAPGASHYSTVDSLRAVADDEFDINVLQTGHSDHHSLALTFEVLGRELSRPGGHPVMNIEVNYEGIGSGSFHPMQRFLWWSHILSGCAGFTYGAQGLWAFEDETYQGFTGSWGEVGWREAAALPGAAHLGWGRRFLNRMSWEQLRPAPLAVRTRNVLTGPVRPYAATIGDSYILAYLPAISLFPDLLSLQHLGIDTGVADADFEVAFINPRSGVQRSSHALRSDETGCLRLPAGTLTAAPSMDDWLVEVLRAGASRPMRTGA